MGVRQPEYIMGSGGATPHPVSRRRSATARMLASPARLTSARLWAPPAAPWVWLLPWGLWGTRKPASLIGDPRGTPPYQSVKIAPIPQRAADLVVWTLNFSPSVGDRTCVKSGEPPCMLHGYHHLHAHGAAKLTDPLRWSRAMLANV